ncbi:MAG: hypothetical protein JSW08_00040 [archaeon]|nr:MAG: hypothetical protein JSW08_00040 [archaeon]
MIDIIFHHANEVVIVQIRRNQVLFGTTTYGTKMADISGLKLDFHGTIKEFPDLEGDIEWREKAIERFKSHIKQLDTEDQIADYIIYELRNKGYSPKLKQKHGFRPIKIS